MSELYAVRVSWHGFSMTYVFAFAPAIKRDVAYSGRILDGFTLASEVTEIKTVMHSLFTLTILSVTSFMTLFAVNKLCS